MDIPGGVVYCGGRHIYVHSIGLLIFDGPSRCSSRDNGYWSESRKYINTFRSIKNYLVMMQNDDKMMDTTVGSVCCYSPLLFLKSWATLFHDDGHIVFLMVVFVCLPVFERENYGSFQGHVIFSLLSIFFPFVFFQHAGEVT